jgi:hypothetical protein
VQRSITVLLDRSAKIKFVPCQTRTGDLGISVSENSHTDEYARYETHVITNYTKETCFDEKTSKSKDYNGDAKASAVDRSRALSDLGLSYRAR